MMSICGNWAALTAFDVARHAFERVSFDLIYGRQNQSANAWKNELKQALTLAIDHISLYQLTIEQGTAFGDRYARGGLLGLPNEDLGADLYTMTQDICNEMGMPGYEVSNHARDGAQSRHNLIYWRYGDYIGIGPGAHGRITMNGHRQATECFSNPKLWLEKSLDGTTEKPRGMLDQSEQAIEFLLMGLRLKEGIDPKRFALIAGKPLEMEKIDHLSELGMITATNDRIIVTDQGFNVLNAVIEALIPD